MGAQPSVVASQNAKQLHGVVPEVSAHSAGTNKSFSQSRMAGKTEDEISYFLMPVYYTTEPLTDTEKEAAVKGFKQITTAQCPEFYRFKKVYGEQIVCRTPMEFFGNQFYRRLLEVHPTCGPLFSKSTMKQGALILRMLSFAVSELDNTEKFEKTFLNLALSHNKIGVKAAEYGVFGEVLFYTLRLCLGLTVYNSDCHAGWTKIYSRILTIIIPAVVRYELRHKDAYNEFKNLRLTTDIPRYSGAIIISGDADATMNSVNARGEQLQILAINNDNEATTVTQVA